MSTTLRPHVDCGHCNGIGRVLLGDHLFATWQAIRSGLPTIPQVHRRLLRNEPGLKVTAVNSRVRELERLGLVRKTSAKAGKAFVWLVTR